MDKLYTAKQVAEILSIHLNNVYPLLQRGKLRGHKIGSNGKSRKHLHWRIKEQDLEEFIDRGAGQHTPSRIIKRKQSGTGR